MPSPIEEGAAEARLGTFRIGLLSLYWVAIGFLWLPLGNFVLTIMLRDLPGVGQAHQGTAVAILEGVGTLVAVFWQPVMGAVSDRTRSRFGRRKPYIFVATIFSALFLLLISRPSPFGNGAASGSGSLAWVSSGAFLWLFLLYFLLQVSENAAQAPYQGLLPDVVPEDERSRASAFVGSGNLFGILLGVVVVGTFMGMRRPDLALTSMAVFLIGAMLVTVLVFPDKVKPAEGTRFNFREVTVGTFAISPKKHKDFMWLMASRLLILVSANGLQKFSVFYFKDVFYPGPGTHLEGLASLASRDLQGIILLVALVATFPAAELSHRLGRRPFIVTSGILGAIGKPGALLRSPDRDRSRHLPGRRLGVHGRRHPGPGERSLPGLLEHRHRQLGRDCRVPGRPAARHLQPRPAARSARGVPGDLRALRCVLPAGKPGDHEGARDPPPHRRATSDRIG